MKEKKKISNKEISTLLLVFGALAVIAAHLVVYSPKMDEVELLNVEIATKETEVARLKELEAQLPVMQEEIENSHIIIENEMKKYPEEVLTESYVMFAEEIRDTLEVDLLDVGISEATLLSQLQIMRRTGEVNALTPMATYLTSLTMNCLYSYSQLKSMVEFIHGGDHRTVLNSVSIAYDSTTAQLAGTVVVDKYFVATPDYQYVPTVIPLVPTGNTNPFGTARGN